MLAVGMTGNTLIAKSVSKPTLEIAQVTHCIHSKISKKKSGTKPLSVYNILYRYAVYIRLPHRCLPLRCCQGERRDMLRRPWGVVELLEALDADLKHPSR